jgi:DNA-binding MarR family transcriptional regulator
MDIRRKGYILKMHRYILKLSKLNPNYPFMRCQQRMQNSSTIKTRSPLPDKALQLIGSKEEGLLQSDLKKLLGVESSKCSKIVLKLMRSGLIKRDSVSTGGYRTYLLKLTNYQPKKTQNIYHIDTYLTEFYLLYLMRGSMD